MILVNGSAPKLMPRQAAAESANPQERASQGSRGNSTRIAMLRFRTLLLPRPIPVAGRTTSPMAAARNTEGSALHTSTNNATPPAATPRIAQPRTPKDLTTSSSTPNTSVRFEPLTASRWLSDVARKISVSSLVIPLRSPTTKEGTRAACSGGEWEAASRSPA